eukprot:1157780-Pelagomonas_calceolata.AAC.25
MQVLAVLPAALEGQAACAGGTRCAHPGQWDTYHVPGECAEVELLQGIAQAWKGWRANNSAGKPLVRARAWTPQKRLWKSLSLPSSLMALTLKPSVKGFSCLKHGIGFLPCKDLQHLHPPVYNTGDVQGLA